MINIVNLPNHLKLNENHILDLYDHISIYTDVNKKRQYYPFPLILKEVVLKGINNNIKDIILPYNSKHVTWKDFIFFPNKDNNCYDNLKEKIKNNNLRYYDYNDIHEKYHIDSFYKNYENTYHIFNDLSYKGYTNNVPNSFNSMNTILYMKIKQNKLEEAFNIYKNCFNGHSDYMICKYLEFLSKKTFENFINNEHVVINTNNNKRYNYITKISYINKKGQCNQIYYDYKYVHYKKEPMKIKNNLNYIRTISTLQENVLSFVFKNLLIKILPPIYDPTNKQYSYSKSFLVKTKEGFKDIYNLSINSEERKVWDNDLFYTEYEKKFKTDLLLLISSKRERIGYSYTLLNHLYSIESVYNYLHYYSIKYIKAGDNELKYFNTTEITEDRAIFKGWILSHFFKGEIIEINRHNLKYGLRKKINKRI
jgi:hypothetical protein